MSPKTLHRAYRQRHKRVEISFQRNPNPAIDESNFFLAGRWVKFEGQLNSKFINKFER